MHNRAKPKSKSTWPAMDKSPWIGGALVHANHKIPIGIPMDPKMRGDK